ncbi:MAG: methyltransferase, partial [Rhodothermales bacterium]|nr:methyltransferase [Rhodothermales bacterium]
HFLAYVRNAGRRVTGVVAGRTSPLETLFPDGSFEVAANLYERAAVLRYVNGIAAASLEAFVRGRPAGTPLRVLEVGAGTGGTTSSLVGVLPAGRSSYVYSDVSDIFLDWGRRKFSDVPFLTTRLFDLEIDPAAQGVEPGSFDVVVGSNAVHAVRDLKATLRRLRTVLAPGGMLLLVESTGAHPWHDITTGLIEGWQHFEDDVRTDSPLLSTETWSELLLDAGFVAADAAPEPDSPAAILKQHVVLAAAPESPAGQASADARPAAEAPAPAVAAHPQRPAAVAAASSSSAQRPAGVAADSAASARRPAAVAADAPAGDGTAAAPSGAVGQQREEAVTQEVRACVMEILRSDPSRPPSRDARLMELGVDSLMAVRLRNLLQERLALEEPLPSTLVFDHPTIRKISELVLEMQDPAEEPDRPDGVAPADEPDLREREVASLTDDEVEAMLLERLEAEEGS